MGSIRLLYIVTHPITAHNLMKGQLAFLKRNGFEVLLIASPGKELDLLADREGIAVRAVPMHREIHPVTDLIALFRIYREILKFKPQIVNASTPKAGLLGMIAAWAARVPVRIYTLRGLRLETTKGFVRKILFMTERIASLCAHQIICVSRSLRQKYTELGIAPQAKTTVLAMGSSNGVDLSRFQENSDDTEALRMKLGIPDDVPVLGFVGRMVNDKGVVNLLEAYDLLLSSFSALRLVVIGGEDHTDPISSEVARKIRTHPQIILAGSVSDPAVYYGLFDLVVFPSFREGFPNVPLEAAAAGIPTVGFRTTGTVDAIEDGVTGTLVPPGDSRALADAIAMYLGNDQIRITHGAAAKERVIRSFQPQLIWDNLCENYRTSLLRISKAQKIRS